MGINVQEAEAAIRQTETEVANAQIAQLRIDTSSAEADERWSDAVAAYDQVLPLMAIYSFAQEGRELANQRMTLDQLAWLPPLTRLSAFQTRPFTKKPFAITSWARH